MSSGQTPFINYEHENDIVMNIINGIRPKIVPGTPLEYKNLMKECWNAGKKMKKIYLDYQNIKIHNFENLPEPRNATEEEQEDNEKEITPNVDEIVNNPNLYSKEQDELEIPDALNANSVNIDPFMIK
ncbi:hypothetical protein GLOIN_2v1767509 [Rhizophagus irregularis DAOM 181602=DAOM 197198]|uniref:Serine-threonine/tyrosine-protein kinase catalytic domain-containing protein n=1 Tax=Rhizophagus irregularis (strain DAOM 181602 / DAOM 197198 / MUCL 43194) TaxID=747089 RepID=A0A2P4QJ87_RHIID|nr:hypothetical protein GLOIN_2v1767509 [Rhizophagus irregularis DAOM 181602=DAOM 197198]POG77676.1 hypothetical protein GLOIN_2v1767509 [Rhizophagus irregularis DAOM 181602=DAOM 197198]|eukprot:XP_025184542.1 hypothetical protein GLOIN_2v1767509 [Rhizophagus irregularis DAOM 181602=DAOM 197198]